MSIQRRGTRVCVSLSPSVCFDSCFTGLITSPSVWTCPPSSHPQSLILYILSIAVTGTDLWLPPPLSLQVQLPPWMAGNYQPGDSRLFQELRGHQGVVVFFSFPGSPEVLWARYLFSERSAVRYVFLCVVLLVPLQSTSSPAIFNSVTRRQVRGKASFFPP